MKTAAIKIDLLMDFLNMKQSKIVLFFLCDPKKSVEVHRAMGKKLVFNRIVDISGGFHKLPETVLAPSSHGRTMCVVDCSCEQSSLVLKSFSDLHYFNITYSWLMFGDNISTVNMTSFLWELKSIQMNSDLTWIETFASSNKSDSYSLIDVYAKGRHLCKDIYQYKYAEWDSLNGIAEQRGYSRYKMRGNFDQLQLRGVTVIDRENVTSDDVDRILSVPGGEQGVVGFVKYHYSLLCILRDYHNFRIKYRVVKGWAGRLKSGYRLGLIGILARNEADVATTAIFQRLNRHAEFDSIHHSWEFSSGFIYRITPQLSASGGGNFFIPFDGNVWITSAVTLLVLTMVLKAVGTIIFRVSRNVSNASHVSYFIDVVAAVAQQGLSNEVSPRTPIRIIMFSLLFLNLVLYNYYTSAVVGGLLSSPGKGPQTIQEIIKSPLTLSFFDIGYHKVLFRETKEPIIQELYRKKLQPSREGMNTIPVYTDVKTAVPFIKKGGYAFHCEMTEAFQAIADQFDGNEICELRTAQSLFSDLKLLSFVLPKRSMYTELFKITLMRARECGLVKRNLKIHHIGKPICQSGTRVHPVELTGVSLAFVVLLGGMFLSIVVLVAEKLFWKQSTRKLNRFYVN
ncbi:ionotropic receptor 75a-like isoform X2 [Wyeomyia smithii]|uniref:ionotropic receptor 75a-like isoform X2 n=1 Tax=Wyeomyia smithii TaxID=174621 RepID=UPI0024680B31|nr:ionotropic receptor 75a-like isoform X2 [Wyeomyia smithii]